MKTRILTALGLFGALALASAQTIPNPQRRSIVKSKLRSLTTALLTICALCLSALPVRAQDPVTISAADFQRLVYSANLHSQLAVKPDLEACLRVLLEMQRRNPNADPAALANLSRQALMLYRTSAPAYIRTNGYPDEILAAYLDAFRQVPARTNFVQANLTLLNGFMLGPADYNSSVPPATLFSTLVDSGNQRLFRSEGTALERQALVDDCAARAQGNPAFAAALDSLLQPETLVSLGDTPAEIIANTNSLLHTNLTMQTMLTLSQSSGNGSLTVSSNQLINLFTNEMQTIWNTTQTNLALLAQFNQSYPDLLAYLTNQAAIDANVQLQAATQQGQPGQIASATAAVFFQSALLQQSQPSLPFLQSTQWMLMEGIVSSTVELGKGAAALYAGSPSGVADVLKGGYDYWYLYQHGTTPPTPQDQLADQVRDIKTLIGDLTTNQNYRFDRVDQSLTTIFNTLNQQFNKIDIMVDAQGHEIATLNGNVDDIRNSLVTVQSSLDRIEGELFTGFNTTERQLLLNQMNGSLFYETQNPSLGPMTLDIYSAASGPENNFYSYATTTANDYNSSPSSGLDLSASGLQQQLTVRPLDANLNYIQEFLRTTLGQTTAGNPPLANPRDWFTGAYAYLQLATENPVNFREKGVRVPAIINAGQNIANFCSSLALSPGTTNINWGLWNALNSYYISDLTNFNSQISATETAYANANNFNLGVWRQWDDAAPRVTATATAVLAAPKLPHAVPIAAGTYFSLALKADGTVVGWGSDFNGQATGGNGLNNVVAIAAGTYFSLALKADGTVVGWGDSTYGQITPFGLNNAVAIAAPVGEGGGGGSGFGLALQADGTVVGWGAFHPPIPAGLSNVVAIAAGLAAGLALKADGTVVGWGSGPAANVPGLNNVVAIAAADGFGLALKADGTVVGWGNNYYGQATIPASATNAVAIAAGNEFGLALKADGTVVGWGRNDHGQTNIPAGLTNVVAIAAGNTHSLALTADGTLVGWGDNGNGELNFPPLGFGDFNFPPPVLTNAVAIAAGYDFTLALKADETVAGWGNNTHGQTTIPAGLSNVVAIAAGAGFSLVLKADGTVVGWGDNTYGQTNIPVGLSNVVAITAGNYHSLALKADGTVVGWGDDGYGETNIPTNLSSVVAIAAGNDFSLALKADGTVVGWGDDGYGQTNTAGLSSVVAIAAGYYHGLALKANGTVVGWGGGPAANPPGLINVVAIAAGNDFSLALKADGTVVGWGYNAYGQTNLGFAGALPLASAPIIPNPSFEANSFTNGVGYILDPFGANNGPIVGWTTTDPTHAGLNPAASSPFANNGVIPDGTNVAFIQSATNSSLSTVISNLIVGHYYKVNFRVNARSGNTPNLKVDVAGANVINTTVSSVGGTNQYQYLAFVFTATAATQSMTLRNDALGDQTVLVDNFTIGVVPTSIPAGLTNVVAIAAGENQSYFLTATATGGSAANGYLSFPQAEIPSNVVSLFRSCNQNTTNQLALSGSDLDNAAGSLSGAKLLLTDVLELGMPYTLERDGVLHGFLYGSESLMDSATATTFLQTQNAQLQTSPNAAIQALTEVAALRYLRFEERLNQSLTNLQATGQPEIPRLVGHTLRLLNLLQDSYATVTNGLYGAPYLSHATVPRSSLEISSRTNGLGLVLYGEPYARYTLQQSSNLTGWANTTITNLRSADSPVGIVSTNLPTTLAPALYFRAAQ